MPGQRHEGTEVFQLARGHLLGVFPVAGPGDADLWLGGGDVVEELAGVVVFCEIGEARGGVDGGEVRAVEGAGEVF